MPDFITAFSSAAAYTLDDNGFKKVMITCVLFMCVFMVYSHVQREQAVNDIKQLQTEVARLDASSVTQRELQLIQLSIQNQNIEISSRLERIENLMMNRTERNRQ